MYNCKNQSCGLQHLVHSDRWASASYAGCGSGAGSGHHLEEDEGVERKK